MTQFQASFSFQVALNLSLEHFCVKTPVSFLSHHYRNYVPTTVLLAGSYMFKSLFYFWTHKISQRAKIWQFDEKENNNLDWEANLAG